jgi:hypothetical protein
MPADRTPDSIPRNLGCALVLASLFLSAPVLAQDAAALTGQWAGDVTETIDGETSRYLMFVSIDADRRGRTWHFEEVITAGRENCAAQVEVEVTPQGDTLEVRLHPVFVPEQLARATLRRAQ